MSATCILCEDPAYIDDLCLKHNNEFLDTASGTTFAAFIRAKVADIRTATLAYMEQVKAETGHVVERAHQFKAGEINGFTLANSAIKHLAIFAKEE